MEKGIVNLGGADALCTVALRSGCRGTATHITMDWANGRDWANGLWGVR